MTSRALFYKGMIEDLRHKIWMIALSCLASFMAMPVYQLLLQQDWDTRMSYRGEESWFIVQGQKIGFITSIFSEYLTITSGIVLVVGALIVGVLGFRYVFSKKMIDLYHSIPIKRTQLFFISYLNGFLIWFIPMMIGAIVCAIMALAFLGNFAAWVSTLGTLAITIANLILAFLLVYHLAIVAVMLSGNILNTLINGTILSFGVLALYTMFEFFSSTYYSTYYSFYQTKILDLLWVSPAMSSVYQLVMRCGAWNSFGFVMNLIMAVVLFGVGFILYLVRPSELAEQGMKLKWVQVIFKTVTVILAGMAGWLFFGLLTGVSNIGWTIFGTIFGSVLTYGILDIIFHMDFKAFFKHKIQMGITTLAAIAIGCIFMFDLTGYDAYVPDTEDIAEMGMFVRGIGYDDQYKVYNGMLSTENRIEAMHYTDKEAISAFLNKAVESKSYDEMPINYSTSTAYVRVTEQSGKTYYRIYRISSVDEEVIVPILTDTSYVEANMIIPKVLIDNISFEDERFDISIDNERNSHYIKDEAFAKELFNAYNIDIAKNPECNIYQNEKIFAQVQYRRYGNEYYYLNLDLYESMENVIAVLNKYDYDFAIHETNPEDVERITLRLSGSTEESLGQLLGLEKTENNIPETHKESAIAYEESKAMDVYANEYYSYKADFTDKKDIAKILDIIRPLTPNNYSLFRADYCNGEVIIYYTDSSYSYVSLQMGVFPKELIGQFERETEIYY